MLSGAVRGPRGPDRFPGIGGIPGGTGPLPVGWMWAATVGIVQPGVGCPGISLVTWPGETGVTASEGREGAADEASCQGVLLPDQLLWSAGVLTEGSGHAAALPFGVGLLTRRISIAPRGSSGVQEVTNCCRCCSGASWSLSIKVSSSSKYPNFSFSICVSRRRATRDFISLPQ